MQTVPHFGVWKRGNHVTPGDSVEWRKEEINEAGEKIIRVRHGVIVAISAATIQDGIKRGVSIAIVHIKSKNTYGYDIITYPLDEYGQPKNYKYDSKHGELDVTERFFIRDFNIGTYIGGNCSRMRVISSEQRNTKDFIRDCTMRAKKVHYIQKGIKIKIENVGQRCVVSVQFTFRVGEHSLVRSAVLDPIPARKPPPPPKPPTPPPPETRLRLYVTQKGWSLSYRQKETSYWVHPKDCKKVSEIRAGLDGIMYIGSEYGNSRKLGIFDKKTNTVVPIDQMIFTTADGTEYYVEDKSKMERYVRVPRPIYPKLPPYQPPPTWAEKNQHLSRYCEDPFEEVSHDEIISLVGDKNNYAIGDILSSDGMPIPRFTGLINGSNRYRKMVIVVGIFKQKRKHGSRFPASTETFAVFAEYKRIQISASSLSENKVIIGKKMWRHPPDWPLRPTRATHTHNVAELFARTWGDEFQYTFERGNCDDLHKDEYYMEKIKDIEFCSFAHPKKASFCRNVVEKTHPFNKTTFSQSCMTPCTPNPTGMCEACNPRWKEPVSGCAHPDCCGPYVLGRTAHEYRDSLVITEINESELYAASAFKENIATVQY